MFYTVLLRAPCVRACACVHVPKCFQLHHEARWPPFPCCDRGAPRGEEQVAHPNHPDAEWSAKAPWPNGEGVGPLIRRLRARDPQGLFMSLCRKGFEPVPAAPRPRNAWGVHACTACACMRARRGGVPAAAHACVRACKCMRPVCAHVCARACARASKSHASVAAERPPIAQPAIARRKCRDARPCVC